MTMAMKKRYNAVLTGGHNHHMTNHTVKQHVTNNSSKNNKYGILTWWQENLTFSKYRNTDLWLGHIVIM